MAKFDIYEAVTERIIHQLQQGVIPWQKPWTGTQHGAISGTTGKPYSLLNQMLLGKPGEYYTYSQVLSRGGAVRKGEKSQIVVFWKQVKVSDMQDDETQSPIDRLIPMLRYYNVFHIDQCDGITPRFNQTAEPTPIPAADEIIDRYSQREHIKIHHQLGDEAYYLCIGCGQLAMTAKGTNSHIIAPLTTRNHCLRSFYYDFLLKSIYR